MGVDEHGEPLFPAGSRTGVYRVSHHVTVDVHRAIALATEGRSQADPAVAIAHFRATLDLVEGEPLANALTGYAWWDAEGHGGRIAAVLVDAACCLAGRAIETDRFEMARWGRTGAAGGALQRGARPRRHAARRDRRRRRPARLQWRECQRMVDALDPGSSPSTAPSRSTALLSRRVHVGARTSEAKASVTPAAND